MGVIKNFQGKIVAYFDRNRPLFSIRIRARPEGPKLGPYVLQKDGLYMISQHWESTEEQQWLDYQAHNGPNSTELASAPANPPYTDAEKAFLKDKWRGEHHFLRMHGLSTYKDEDREEGRVVLRALMHDDDSDEDFQDDQLNYFGHQADYNLTKEQLDWIEKRQFGGLHGFLMT